MTKRLKIVIAARDAVGTGGGTVALQTALCLSRNGHDVKLVVDYALQSPTPDIEVFVTRFGDRLKRWSPSGKIGARARHFLQLLAFSIFGRMKLAQYERRGYTSVDHNIEAFGGDLVVLHNVFIHQARADRRPVRAQLSQYLNPVFGFRIVREMVLFRSRRVKGFVAVAEQTMREARPYIRQGTPCAVISNGIDLERFHPLEAAAQTARKAELGAAGKFVVLFVGHEFERKRLDLVLEAMVLLPEQTILWVIGGRGSSLEEYIGLARKLGVGGRVEFLGTRRDTERYFQAADVFVLPSNYEAWPLVCLEAMACGVPVLMTPVGCAADIIDEGANGYIVPYDAVAIAERIGRMQRDAPRHAAMRIAARATATGHSWDKVAGAYAEIIAQLARREVSPGT